MTNIIKTAKELAGELRVSYTDFVGFLHVCGVNNEKGTYRIGPKLETKLRDIIDQVWNTSV